MASRVDLGTLVASIDANTHGYERAMAKMEALTVAVTRKIETNNNQATRSTEKMNKSFGRTVIALVGMKVAIMAMMALGAGIGIGNLLGGAASGAIALAGGAVIAAQALVPLTGALAALPFLLGTAIQGIATLTLGTSDLRKALQAKDITAFNQEIAGMDPVTQKAAKSLWSLKQVFRDIKASAAAGLLPGLVEGVQSATNNVGLLKDVLYGTGKVLGDVFKDFGEYIGGADFAKLFESLSGSGANALKAMGGAGLELFKAFMKIGVAAKPLTDFLTVQITKFGKWITKTVDASIASGKFTKFIELVVDNMIKWGHILWNLGSTIVNVFKAASGPAQIFLGWLEGASEKLKTWTESTDGMKKMSDFFTNISGPLSALGAGLGQIALSLGALFSPEMMGALTSVIKPLGEGLAYIASTQLAPTFEALAPVLAAIIPPLAELVVQIGNIGTAVFNAFLPGIQALMPELTTFLGLIGPVLADAIANMTPGITALGLGLGQLLYALEPMIPLWASWITYVGSAASVTIWLLTNAVIALIKGFIFLGTTMIDVAKGFVQTFFPAIGEGFSALLGGVAALARAMGNEGLAQAADIAGDQFRNMSSGAVNALNSVQSSLDATQGRLNLLAYGVTIPIRVQYTDTSSLAGIAKASAGTASPPVPKTYKPPKIKKFKMPKFTGGGGSGAAGGGGGGGGSSKTSKKQDAIKQWKTGLGGFAAALTGIAKESNPVYDAYHKMVDGIWKYLGKKTQKFLAGDVKWLDKLYKKNQKIIEEVKAAQAVVDRLKSEKSQFASDMANSMKDWASLAQAYKDQQSTAGTNAFWQNGQQGGTGSLVGRMSGRLSKLKEFWGNITKLRSMGLSDDMIRQIIDLGFEDGNSLAKEILSAPSSIGELNKTNADIKKYATDMGITASNWMYDAGIKAAEGIVAGLKKQEKAIEAQMNRIAEIMLKAIKKSLGIKSPSREFEAISGYSVDGLVRGFQNNEGSAVAAVRALYDAITNETLDSPGYRGANYQAGTGAGSKGDFVLMPGAITIDASGNADPEAVKQATVDGVRAAFSQFYREVKTA